jgi:hypothetical protein
VSDASRERPGQPDGPENTSGRRKPEAWSSEELEEERKAQAGSSAEGRDGGRDARRKLRGSADGKPEIVNDESARDFGLWRFRLMAKSLPERFAPTSSVATAACRISLPRTSLATNASTRSKTEGTTRPV